MKNARRLTAAIVVTTLITSLIFISTAVAQPGGEEDKAIVGFESASITIHEGTPLGQVNLVTQGSGRVDVTLDIEAQTAKEGKDYTFGGSRSVGEVDGRYSALIVGSVYDIIDDDIAEEDEYFTIILRGNPDHIGEISNLTVRIIDDDRKDAESGVLELRAESGEDNLGRYILFVVDRVGGLSGELTARFELVPETGSPSDLRFNPFEEPLEFTLASGRASRPFVIYAADNQPAGEPAKTFVGLLEADDPSVLGESVKVVGVLPASQPLPTPTATPEPTPTTAPEPAAPPEPTPPAEPTAAPNPTATPDPTPTATPEPPVPAEPAVAANPTATPDPTPTATPEPPAPAEPAAPVPAEPAAPDEPATPAAPAANTEISDGDTPVVVEDRTEDLAADQERAAALAAPTPPSESSRLGAILLLVGLSGAGAVGLVLFMTGRKRRSIQHF